MRIAAILGLLALAGCYPEPFGRTSVEIRDEKLKCESDGGTFGPGGISQALMCFKKTQDAGKSCYRSSDCEGLCIAPELTNKGQCAAQTPQFGCIPIFDENGDQVTICID